MFCTGTDIIVGFATVPSKANEFATTELPLETFIFVVFDVFYYSIKQDSWFLNILRWVIFNNPS